MAKKKNYLHIPAVGQLDEYACWAASLKWWYQAARSIKASQRKLIDRYNYLSDEYGAMSSDSIEFIIVDNGMYPYTPSRASELTVEELKKMLKFSPVFIAYTETSSRKKHVNVIYDVVESGGNTQVKVMEPQVTQNEDLTYKGAHQLKLLSDFNTVDTVYCGSL